MLRSRARASTTSTAAIGVVAEYPRGIFGPLAYGFRSVPGSLGSLHRATCRARMERRLLFAKLLHFLSCFAGAAWGRYQGIYLNTHRHLSPVENGLVRGGGLLAKFLFTPLVRWLDRFCAADPKIRGACMLLSPCCLGSNA